MNGRERRWRQIDSDGSPTRRAQDDDGSGCLFMIALFAGFWLVWSIVPDKDEKQQLRIDSLQQQVI